jgi:hypothetical protein
MKGLFLNVVGSGVVRARCFSIQVVRLRLVVQKLIIERVCVIYWYSIQ